ncbi:MAG: hypothetical protein HYX34_07235 [Actinobacteria bacterium]|nr:hypothetical protein [Actinomycetota bacterium]
MDTSRPDCCRHPLNSPGFGFRRFTHYRIRVLLYAGKPNSDLLATVTPR